MSKLTYWIDKHFKSPKIIMTLLTRNESDLLETNIEYHLSIGVDFFIITDNNSTDHTAEIIKKYEQKGLAKYIFAPSTTFEQSKMVTEMAKMAYNEYGATWVINNDTDEFWWTDEKDLKKVLKSISARVDVLYVNRTNFIPRNSISNKFYEDMDIQETVSLNPLGNKLPPKAMHRSTPNIHIDFGNHDADAPEFRNKITSTAIEIFHFPIRNFQQFENKISVGGNAVNMNKEIPINMCYTWRKLYEIYLKGELKDYYNNQIFSNDTIAERIAKNELVIDTRLKDFLNNIFATHNNKLN